MNVKAGRINLSRCKQWDRFAPASACAGSCGRLECSVTSWILSFFFDRSALLPHPPSFEQASLGELKGEPGTTRTEDTAEPSDRGLKGTRFGLRGNRRRAITTAAKFALEAGEAGGGGGGGGADARSLAVSVRVGF